MKGSIRKMQVELSVPVGYQLPMDDKFTKMNKLIGKKIKLTYSGEIGCIACGNKIKKSYNQGHCYPCFIKLASCDLCIMKPETCHFDKGTCREPDWARDHCMKPHYVYLANSSGVKVGITREEQIPTRWIDQGAAQALPIFKVATRLQSGLIEVELKKFVSDRTDWRKMLKSAPEEVDLASIRDELFEKSKTAIKNLQKKYGEEAIVALTNEDVVEIEYPVTEYPEKVKSLNFDKQDEIEGVLKGIKGQYLILDCGVLNMRKFAGYEISLK